MKNVNQKSIQKMVQTKLTGLLILSLFSFSHITNANSDTDIDKKYLVPIANWASIIHDQLFIGQYSKPSTWDIYRYVCFLNSNCIGINQSTLSVDVLINGQIQSIAGIEEVMNMIADSNNAVINLSGETINQNIIAKTFSPGKGKAIIANGQIISYTWQIIINEATNQQEICEFSGIVNAAKPTSFSSVSFKRNKFAGSELIEWTTFAFSNDGLPG